MTNQNPPPGPFSAGGTLDEFRAKAAINRANRLFQNRAIDNASRGPLNVFTADNLPRFLEGGQRIQWQEISFTAGATYDTSAGNNWMTALMQTTANASDTNLMDARCVLNLRPEMRVAFAHIVLGLNNNIVRIGLVDNPLANLTEPTGCFFRSVDGGNWFAVVRNGGSETATDTGVVASETAREFRIVVTSPTRVEFFIDGNLEHSESGGNVPNGSTLLRANVELYARIGATGNELLARVSDYMSLSRLTRG
jgi:hypothetical protein